MSLGLLNETIMKASKIKSTVVGNITFTEEGIVVKLEKPYKDGNENPFFFNGHSISQLRIFTNMQAIIKLRMQHCSDELNKHIHDSDVFVTENYVCWNGGHFDRGIYDMMSEFVEYKFFKFDDNFRMTIMMTQQVVRYLYEYKGNIPETTCDLTAEELFRICTELLLTLKCK